MICVRIGVNAKELVGIMRERHIGGEIGNAHSNITKANAIMGDDESTDATQRLVIHGCLKLRTPIYTHRATGANASFAINIVCWT
jgi:hypothetical protein